LARLLVTGASGLLGANLVWEAIRSSHRVAAASQRNRVRLAGVDSYTLDLSDREAAEALVVAAAPEWIVHCAAAADVDACERDPVMARRLNRDMAEYMAVAARRHGAAFVFISTDAVFDGKTGDYDEDAEPHPLSVYGRSKLEGEWAVCQAHPEALVVRTNIYGWNAQDKRSLAEWFLKRCQDGLRSPGWTDVASTPILVNDLAEVLLRLLDGGHSGVYHVGGATCLSKHEFGRRVVSAFGYDPDLIDAALVAGAGLDAPRAKQLCLRGRKVEQQLRLRLPTVNDGLDRFRGMWDDGSVGRLKALVAASPPVSPAVSRKAAHR
jgi:dTDP-4-dehydrorhamnose reductase